MHSSLLVLVVHVKFATVSVRSSMIPDITGRLSTIVEEASKLLVVFVVFISDVLLVLVSLSLLTGSIPFFESSD